MKPASLPQLLSQADHALADGNPDLALQLLEQARQLAPENPQVAMRLSVACFRAGRFRESQRHLETVAAPNAKPELGLALARQLLLFLDELRLIETLRAPRFRREATPQQLSEAGVLLSNIGEQDAAVELLELALARDPRHPAARYFRGNLRLFEGDLEGAEQEFERCLKADPRFAQASWVLSSLRRNTAERNHVDRLRAQLRQAQPGLNAEIYLNFALFNELHDLGDYAEAWQALERGCAAKRRRIRYDHRANMAVFEAVQAQCSADFVADAAPLESSLTPIFIVGMHRSGTTLLERILAAHPRVFDGGESYAFSVELRHAVDFAGHGVLDLEMVRRAPNADFAALGQAVSRRFERRAQARSHYTEKLPSNFLNLGYIAKALPHARFLHLVRDPTETCFSNLRTLFSEACGYSYVQQELADHFLAYRRLMAHWERVLPGRILDVDFNRLITETDTVAAEVLQYCGLPQQADLVARMHQGGAVATASSAQVRRGIQRDSVPAWSHYAEQLQPLRQRLARLTD